MLRLELETPKVLRKKVEVVHSHADYRAWGATIIHLASLGVRNNQTDLDKSQIETEMSDRTHRTVYTRL